MITNIGLDLYVYSVGNPRDQMTRCTEFVTIFSSASGFLEYLDLYLQGSILALTNLLNAS